MTGNTDNGDYRPHIRREHNHNGVKTALILIVISILLLDWVSRG